jgi:tetratricopeptide (TPR) repeat protein
MTSRAVFANRPWRAVRSERSLPAVMTRVTLGWIAAILVVSAAAARADGTSTPAPAAKPFVDAGVAAYGAADYETAAREFAAAYKIDPKPAMLYAWAQSLRLGNHCVEAIDAYRRYLATSPNEAQSAAARNGISLCERARPAEPAASSTEPARSAASPAIDDPRPRRWYADPLGGALVIGGVASIGVGVGFLVRSSQNRDAALDATYREDFVEQLDAATLQRRIGAVGLGLGAALVTGGILRYVTRRDEPSGAQGPRRAASPRAGSRSAARSEIDPGRPYAIRPPGAVTIAISGRSLVITGSFR